MNAFTLTFTSNIIVQDQLEEREGYVSVAAGRGRGHVEDLRRGPGEPLVETGKL